MITCHFCGATLKDGSAQDIRLFCRNHGNAVCTILDEETPDFWSSPAGQFMLKELGLSSPTLESTDWSRSLTVADAQWLHDLGIDPL